MVLLWSDLLFSPHYPNDFNWHFQHTFHNNYPGNETSICLFNCNQVTIRTTIQGGTPTSNANKVISPDIFSTPTLSIKTIIIFSTHITSTGAFSPYASPSAQLTLFICSNYLFWLPFWATILEFQKNIFLYANEWSWICFKRKQKMLWKWFFLYIYIYIHTPFFNFKKPKTFLGFWVFITKYTHIQHCGLLLLLLWHLKKQVVMKKIPWACLLLLMLVFKILP